MLPSRASLTNADKEGWLTKQGTSFLQNWLDSTVDRCRRFFLLRRPVIGLRGAQEEALVRAEGRRAVLL